MGRRGRSGGMPHKVASEVGAYGERLAARYLARRGLQVLERNWRCAQGEVDIVALDGDCLVVCEVKTPPGPSFGDPVEAVTWRKAARLRRLAACWLAEHPGQVSGVGDVRVDVVGVLRPRTGPARVEHLVAVASVKLGRTRSVALVGLDGALVDVEADLVAGPAAVHDQRAAGCGVHAVPGPDQGGRGELGGAGAEPAVDGQPVAGVDAQGRQRLRPADRHRRPGGRGAGPGRGRDADGAHRRAGSRRFGPARARACCRPCWPRPGSACASVVVPADNAAEAALVPGMRVLPARAPGRAGQPLPAAEPGRGPRRAGRGGRPSPTPEPRAGPARRRRPGRGAAGAGDRGGGWAPPASWSARRAPARRCWPSGCPACSRRWSREHALEVTAVQLGAGRAARSGALVVTAALRRAAPQRVDGGDHRRRQRLHPARRDLAGAPRRALPRRGAGVHAVGARRRCASRSSPGEVTIARARAACAIPARFQLVLAANPCPCGRGFGKGADCSCSPAGAARLHGQAVGPLLDRVDLQLQVHAVSRAALGRAVRRGHRRRGRARRCGPRASRPTGSPARRWQVNAEVPGPDDAPWAVPAAARGDRRPRPGHRAGRAHVARLRPGARAGVDRARPRRRGHSDRGRTSVSRSPCVPRSAVAA